MARINIEDSLFRDSRFWNLIIKAGCSYKALGYVTKAWILAQENWIKHKCIPAKAWPVELNVLIEVELAEKSTDGSVYVKGSKASFEWLEKRIDAAKLGGIKSSKRARDEKGRLISVDAHDVKNPSKHPSKIQANPSASKPPTPTPTLTLKNSSTQNFNDQFNAEYQGMLEVLDIFDLKVLGNKNTSQLLSRFETAAAFRIFVNELVTTCQKKNITGKAERSYIFKAIQSEIGAT